MPDVDVVVGRRVEHLMGTVFSFDLRDPVSVGVVDEVVEWLHWVDATFSTYVEDSEISQLRRRDIHLAECAPEVADVLAQCAQLERDTDGAFSAHYSGLLDPSGLVKGWAIERAAQLLTEAGSTRHAVNGGGDVRAVGRPEPGRSWQIGVVDPFDPRSLATVLSVVDGAVATSGTAERGLHVVDPRGGLPAQGLASVTVVGPNLALADAYATAAMVKGAEAPAWVEGLDGYDAFAVATTGERWQTSGFAAWTA